MDTTAACPHVGAKLHCTACDRDGHDEAACWKRHPELVPAFLRNKGKGKGKGMKGNTKRGNNDKNQGNGQAPAGGALAPT